MIEIPKHWTLEELRAQFPISPEALDAIEDRVAEAIEDNPEARPVGVLSLDEASEIIMGMISTAQKRVLTYDEGFLFGQMLEVFKMAVRAELMGAERAIVFTEEEIRNVCAGESPR